MRLVPHVIASNAAGVKGRESTRDGSKMGGTRLAASPPIPKFDRVRDRTNRLQRGGTTREHHRRSVHRKVRILPSARCCDLADCRHRTSQPGCYRLLCTSLLIPARDMPRGQLCGKSLRSSFRRHQKAGCSGKELHLRPRSRHSSLQPSLRSHRVPVA